MASRMFFGFLMLFTLVSFVPPGAGMELVNFQGAMSGQVPVLVREGVTSVVRDVVLSIAPERAQVANLAKEQGSSLFFSALDSLTKGEEIDESWKSVSAKDESPDVRSLFSMIELARTEDDMRSCYGMTDTPDGPLRPTHGDWLAYCLARVTRDPRRCVQIDTLTTPPLRTLCDKELPSSASSPSASTL